MKHEGQNVAARRSQGTGMVVSSARRLKSRNVHLVTRKNAPVPEYQVPTENPQRESLKQLILCIQFIYDGPQSNNSVYVAQVRFCAVGILCARAVFAYGF
jgi:hypothetical protein